VLALGFSLASTMDTQSKAQY